MMYELQIETTTNTVYDEPEVYTVKNYDVGVGGVVRMLDEDGSESFLAPGYWRWINVYKIDK